MGDELNRMGSERELRWSALLRLSNRGDRAAYVQFLSEIAPVLRGVIMARSGRACDESEDILQNTLIAIHEKRHTWRDTDAVSPWLYAIARYKVADALRKKARRPLASLDGSETDLPDDRCCDPTVQSDLRRLLAQLDDSSATIIRDIKLGGLSAEEAGAPLGMTAGAVRVALCRAMAKLAALAQGEIVSQRSGPKVRK